MGPGCFYPGNEREPVHAAGGDRASMGPGCFYPGNLNGISAIDRIASLQWGRDVSIPEISGHRRARWCRGCFNGAGMFLSRKSGRGIRRAGRAPGFNGAGMFLSRKSRWPARADSRSRCFNGAGMFLSRKFALPRLPAAHPLASMGPGCFYPGNSQNSAAQSSTALLQWGRDVSIPEITRRACSRSRRGRFNGAGMFLSRK